MQNLSNETAEKWLKMTKNNAKGPTVLVGHKGKNPPDSSNVKKYLEFPNLFYFALNSKKKSGNPQKNVPLSNWYLPNILIRKGVQVYVGPKIEEESKNYDHGLLAIISPHRA